MDDPHMQTVEKHSKAGAQALVVMFVLTIAGFFLIPAALHEALPPDWMEGAALEWAINASPLNGASVGPHTGSRFVFVAACALIALGGVAAGVYGAWTLRLIPVIFAGAAFGLVLGLADYAIERDWGVAIWSDRIEVRGGDAPRHYRPEDVVRVEAACYLPRSRRSRNRRPTIDYRLVFADEAYVDLAATRPGRRENRSAWLHTVGALDRSWGANAPRMLTRAAILDPAEQARCMQKLQADLEPRELAVARRVLGVEAALIDAVPSEAW